MQKNKILLTHKYKKSSIIMITAQLVKKVFYNQFDKSQKFLEELFSLVKSSSVATSLTFKNTFASIKTLRALLSNSHSLLKKRGKTFKGKLRFPICKQKFIDRLKGKLFVYKKFSLKKTFDKYTVFIRIMISFPFDLINPQILS